MAIRPRRPEADEHAREILAAFQGRACPEGGNSFLHLAALFPSRRSPAWPRIAAAFRSLPQETRRRIIRRRRLARFGPDPRSILDPDY
jgi:hypothetical protein